jgi:hypothetical protein
MSQSRDETYLVYYVDRDFALVFGSKLTDLMAFTIDYRALLVIN